MALVYYLDTCRACLVMLSADVVKAIAWNRGNEVLQQNIFREKYVFDLMFALFQK